MATQLEYEERHNKINAVTYWPATRKFYVGALDTDIVDVRKDSEYTQIARLNLEKATIEEGKFEPLDQEYWRAAERQMRAGVRDTSTITNIQVTQLLTQLINEEWRNFFAINGCTRIPVPKLKLDIPYISTRRTAQKKVPELVDINLDKSVESKVSLSLWKNADAVGVSDEAQFQANIAPFELEINQTAGALGLAWNDQITAEIETFTATTEADWGAMTTNADFSANNPLDDIQGVETTINSNHLIANTITMHPRVFSDYLSNTFINGYDPAADRTGLGTGVFPLPKYNHITVIRDAGFTNTKASLYDRRGIVFGEGPTVAEQARNASAGASMYYIRQFGEVKKVDNIFGRTMTVVSA